ncbi:MAG: CRISPR-associated endoribonuclease Cas6 [Paludibacter sp.]|nr:CRISPR-associated endoribonuclease Cas6 [Paludibacter sp.]
MRFKITLTLDKKAFGDRIPLNYQYECSAVIYKILSKSNESYSRWLHDNGFRMDGKQFKLFTFSRLQIAQWKIQDAYLQILSDKVEWEISFLPERSTQEFIQGLFKEQTFALGNRRAKVRFTVQNIELMPSPVFTETMQFECMSPVCLNFKRDDGGYNYIDPENSAAPELIKQNLLNKFKAFTGEIFTPENFPFEFKVITKPKSSLITIKANTPEESKIRGFHCRFQLTAPVELMKIMYESGIGGKNSIGFGMVKLASFSNLTGSGNLSGLKGADPMMKVSKDAYSTEQLEYGKFYHIYNCGINGCNLFNEPENYQYFLHLYDKYISAIADTYAWVLMPNHFHLLVRIKDEEEIRNSIAKIDEISKTTTTLTPQSNSTASYSNLTGFENLSGLEEETANMVQIKPLHQYFSNLFNAYSKAFNIRFHRHGALFERPFKRKLIENKSYLKNVLLYIHNNPVLHGFTDCPVDYPCSSYLTCVSIKPTKLKREQVIGWFDNEANFISYHDKKMDIQTLEKWLEL